MKFMSINLRDSLNGRSLQTLKDNLAAIQDNPVYSHFADVLRAFLSNDKEQVLKFQQDERPLVATAAAANGLADLNFIGSNFKKFAFVAALNPSIDEKLAKKLQKYEHSAIPIFIAANEGGPIELKVFNYLASEGPITVDEDKHDGWYEESLELYEESPSRAIAEILQLLTLEILGFFNEGGGYPLWQLIEDDFEFEPHEKPWKLFATLPRVPKELYEDSPIAVNVHVAREVAAEMAIGKDLIAELAKDDCQLGSDINNTDTWFTTRSPRASVAKSEFTPAGVISQIIEEEIALIESRNDYVESSLSTLWRIAGNPKLKTAHIERLYLFAKANLHRCKDEMFEYDLRSMLEGGTYVDNPLLANPGFPEKMREKFTSLLQEMESTKLI
jgi:hypothetical protein